MSQQDLVNDYGDDVLGNHRERAWDLWDGLIEQKMVETSGDRVHIRYAGRQLLEGRIGPFSWGLFAAQMRDHNVVAGAIGGVVGAVIGGLIVWWLTK